MSIELVTSSNNLILCCPLLLPPSIFLSIRVFSDESVLRIRWPKNWSFSFNIIPSNEYSGLISFRMDWLDLLAVQGTLKSLLQHYSSKPSILRRSAFFIVQLSHPYMWESPSAVILEPNLSDLQLVRTHSFRILHVSFQIIALPGCMARREIAGSYGDCSHEIKRCLILGRKAMANLAY